jgi:hypothetical protein
VQCLGLCGTLYLPAQEVVERLLDEKRRMEEDMSLRAKHIEMDADAELEDVRSFLCLLSGQASARCLMRVPFV